MEKFPQIDQNWTTFATTSAARFIKALQLEEEGNKILELNIGSLPRSALKRLMKFWLT